MGRGWPLARSPVERKAAREVACARIVSRVGINTTCLLILQALGRSPATAGLRLECRKRMGEPAPHVPPEILSLLASDNAADIALYQHAVSMGAPCTRAQGSSSRRCGVVASIDAVEAWARRALQNTRARAVWQPEPRRSTGEPHGPERSAEGIQHRRSALWSGVGRMFHTASARGSRVDRSADASNGHAALPASLPSTPGIARAGTHNAARGICDVPPQLDERPCLEWTVERFSANPLISHQLTNMSNINGPSVIRAPGWLRTITARGYTIGRYLMYFSGRFSTGIRLASAEQLSGPWRFHPVPVLDVSDVRAAGCHSHVASPDVHVEEGARRLRMLFHCPSRSSTRHDQLTFAATSRDGLRFRSRISTHPRNIAS